MPVRIGRDNAAEGRLIAAQARKNQGENILITIGTAEIEGVRVSEAFANLRGHSERGEQIRCTPNGPRRFDVWLGDNS